VLGLAAVGRATPLLRAPVRRSRKRTQKNRRTTTRRLGEGRKNPRRFGSRKKKAKSSELKNKRLPRPLIKYSKPECRNTPKCGVTREKTDVTGIYTGSKKGPLMRLLHRRGRVRGGAASSTKKSRTIDRAKNVPNPGREQKENWAADETSRTSRRREKKKDFPFANRWAQGC